MEVPCCMDSEISAENSVRKDKGYLGAELKQLARNYECKILEGAFNVRSCAHTDSDTAFGGGK